MLKRNTLLCLFHTHGALSKRRKQLWETDCEVWHVWPTVGQNCAPDTHQPRPVVVATKRLAPDGRAWLGTQRAGMTNWFPPNIASLAVRSSLRCHAALNSKGVFYHSSRSDRGRLIPQWRSKFQETCRSLSWKGKSRIAGHSLRAMGSDGSIAELGMAARQEIFWWHYGEMWNM